MFETALGLFGVFLALFCGFMAIREARRSPKDSVPENGVKLPGGQVLFNVHSESQCAGRACCIHNPSDHHMREWPQNFRSDRYMMERICSHGVGHPDPDDTSGDSVHGCDGCCARKERR